MFGSKGFSNPLGDDILNSFIQDTAKKQPYKPTEADEKHLLATKKMVQQLADEEESQAKKSPVIKTTSSLAQSNVVKKKSPEKGGDDIDDLLDLIDDAKGSKQAPKKMTEPPKSQPVNKTPPKATPTFSSQPKATISAVNNKFAEVLSDEEEDIPAYDPTVRDTSSRRPNTASSDDVNKRKGALFGLSNSAMTNLNKTHLSEMQNSVLPQPRPQTMESKPQKDEDDIGEINLGFSRRKNQASGAKKRTTSTDEPKPVIESTVTLSPGKQSGLSRPSWENKDGEGDSEEESKYLASFMNKDKKDQKSLLGVSKFGDKGSVGRIATITNTAEISSPIKSPRSEFVTSKEGFFREPSIAQGLGNDKKEDSVIPRNPIGILGKKDLLDPYGQQQQLQQPMMKNVTNLGNSAVRKERVDGFGSRTENLQGSGVSAMSAEGSIHHMVKDVGLQGYLKETEEYYKKRAKESEDYYENRYKQLKKAMEEEKSKWEEIHEKEMKLVRKENEDLKEHMSKHLERERERMKEMFVLEMESKEKIHSYELQRQRHQFEEENNSLKKQLEAQAKLNSLADEIKLSSNKLVSLSDKMENGTGLSFGKKGEFREKEKQLEELENRLRHEFAMVNDEKKRLDKIRMELDERDRGERDSMEKEREILRQEYKRLNDMQEAVRRQEMDKLRDLEKEKSLYQMERDKVEREALRIKEEYGRKYHELEVQVELHAVRKNEFERALDKTEMDFLKRQQEMEATMKRLSALENELMGRVRELEHKEMMVNKSNDEAKRRLDLLELERIQFEKERNQVIKMVDKTREDSEKMSRFKQEFEDEQGKNVLLRNELATFAASLRNEKNQLEEEKANFSKMAKTFEGMKNEYVKDIGLGLQRPLAETNISNKPPHGHVREKSQDSFFEKAPYSYTMPQGAAWNSAHKNPNTGQENRFEGGLPPYGGNVSGDERLVRLKDLKNGVNSPTLPREMEPWNEPRVISPVKKAEEQSKLFKKVMGNSDGFQNWAKSTANTEAKGFGGEKFNYKDYMAKLKEFDRTSGVNQSYLEMEKEELLQKRMSSGSAFSPKKPYSLTGRSRSEKI